MLEQSLPWLGRQKDGVKPTVDILSTFNSNKFMISAVVTSRTYCRNILGFIADVESLNRTHSHSRA